MTENEIKKHLEEYRITVDETAKRIAVQKAAEAAQNRFAPMGIKDFILNQLHYIKPYYWILCLAYMITVPAAAAGAGRLKAVIWISIATPLLAVFTAPGILSQFDSGIAELESACLYRVSSVFSARLIIYGTANFICILLSAVFAIPFFNEFVWIVLFETMLFICSALICLMLSFFIRNQYASAVTAVLSLIFSLVVFSEDNLNYPNMVNPGNYISLNLMGIVIAVSSALLILFTIFLYNRCSHSLNGGKYYGN